MSEELHPDLDSLLKVLSIPKRIRELKSLHKGYILIVDTKLKKFEELKEDE